MTKTQAIILGKFLVGDQEIPELSKVRITKNTPKNVGMAILMLKGAPNIQDETLRKMILVLFKENSNANN